MNDVFQIMDPAPKIEVRDDMNKVFIGSNWRSFANFTYVIQRHGFDIETSATKIILDCKTIKGKQEFTLVLDSGDLDTEKRFFQAYDRLKPASVGAKLYRDYFNPGKILQDIRQKDADYIATDEKRVLVATQPCFIYDPVQNLSFYIVEGYSNTGCRVLDLWIQN